MSPFTIYPEQLLIQWWRPVLSPAVDFVAFYTSLSLFIGFWGGKE